MRFANTLTWQAPHGAVNIDLTEDADIAYWTQALACNSHELLGAVQAVGISVSDITAHLNRGAASAS